MMTEDHPYDYASFEGMIPEGNYGAGNVIIWDAGKWEFIEPGDDPVRALAQGKLTFRLFGKKLFGEWALVKIKGRSPKGNEWLLLKHRDAYANDTIDITEFAPRSIVSDLDVDDIGADRIWESNRKTARKAPTLAARLAREERAATKTRTKVASRSRRAPAARSPAASSRKGSSHAGAPRSAPPTRRRRPR